MGLKYIQTKDFQTPYWKRALDVEPPPQAELYRLVYNGSVSVDSKNSLPVLTVKKDGTLEFVANGQSEHYLSVNRNFIQCHSNNMNINKQCMLSSFTRAVYQN